MKTRVVKIIKFAAGHRVFGHESVCAGLHGHNYTAHIYAEADKLDAIGRVVDFGVIKKIVGGWINDHIDHAFLVHGSDSEAIAALRMVKGQRIYMLQDNPTAENIAAFLLQRAAMLLDGERLRIVKVVLWETDTCCAVCGDADDAPEFVTFKTTMSPDSDK